MNWIIVREGGRREVLFDLQFSTEPLAQRYLARVARYVPKRIDLDRSVKGMTTSEIVAMLGDPREHRTPITIVQLPNGDLEADNGDHTGVSGRVAYEAYGESRHWKTYDDKPMPPWDDVLPAIQEAWATASSAVIGAWVAFAYPDEDEDE